MKKNTMSTTFNINFFEPKEIELAMKRDDIEEQLDLLRQLRKKLNTLSNDKRFAFYLTSRSHSDKLEDLFDLAESIIMDIELTDEVPLSNTFNKNLEISKRFLKDLTFEQAIPLIKDLISIQKT